MERKNQITRRTETTALASIDEIEQAFDTGQTPQIESGIASIKILRESQEFEWPAGAKSKTFTANIVFYHRLNSYFAGPYDPDATADCMSIDAEMPSGGENPRLGPCSGCPLNEWGSAETGAGKACGNYLNLFVLPEGDEIPYVLRCPPTSLGKRGSLVTFLTYAPNQVKKATGSRAYQLLTVEFSLTKQTFASGVASLVTAKTVGALDPKKDADRIETCMFWFRRIRDEWERNRVRAAEDRKAIAEANAELKAEREAKDEDVPEDIDFTGEPNPDYIGDNPVPVGETDTLPF